MYDKCDNKVRYYWDTPNPIWRTSQALAYVSIILITIKCQIVFQILSFPKPSNAALFRREQASGPAFPFVNRNITK